METDISKALTYQVKKEIADKYFGYRKIIEEDKNALENARKKLETFYEKKIGRDLVRLYSLICDKKLIEYLMNLLGWQGLPFYDDYVVQSETIRAALLKDMDGHGWTDSGRFKNLVLDSYKRLFKDSQHYHEKYEEIVEEAQIINEEIRQFKEKFSLDEIMSFMRSLDYSGEASEILERNVESYDVSELEEKLSITPVGDAYTLVPQIPDLPEPDHIKSELKALAEKAFEIHRKEQARLFLRDG